MAYGNRLLATLVSACSWSFFATQIAVTFTQFKPHQNKKPSQNQEGFFVSTEPISIKE
jgi:hypothetical protein